MTEFHARLADCIAEGIHRYACSLQQPHGWIDHRQQAGNIVNAIKHLVDEPDDAADLSRLINRQSDLLTGVVNAIKGDPPELTLWSHHDAPELAADVVAERDRYKAALHEIYVDATANGVWVASAVLFEVLARHGIDTEERCRKPVADKGEDAHCLCVLSVGHDGNCRCQHDAEESQPSKEINQGVRDALRQLDGSTESAVSLLTGLTATELNELGGLEEPQP